MQQLTVRIETFHLETLDANSPWTRIFPQLKVLNEIQMVVQSHARSKIHRFSGITEQMGLCS